MKLFPASEYHEDYGDVMWFHFGHKEKEHYYEPPDTHCGSPLEDDFYEPYWTHFVHIDFNYVIEQALEMDGFK